MEASREPPGLLRRVKTKFCTVKTVRVVVVIKFIIALVTCVIVFSQIINNTDYLISHYCVLNYFEKKFLGQEDIIELQDHTDITFCHSSIALDFAPEDMRVAVNTSAGLLAALCLVTCVAAPVTLAGLQHCRPLLVLSWFVVTVCRAAIVTVAAAVFVSRGWSRFTAMTRHPVALFMTHLGCALLDVLTDLPAMMLYRSMAAGGDEQQVKVEDGEEETQFIGEKEVVAEGGEGEIVCGSDVPSQEEDAVPSVEPLGVENMTTSKDRGTHYGTVSENVSGCGSDEVAKAEKDAVSQEETKALSERRKDATQDSRRIAESETGKYGAPEVESKENPEGREGVNSESKKLATSETRTDVASKSDKDIDSEGEQNTDSGEGGMASSDRKCGPSEHTEKITVKSHLEDDSKREEKYGGTVFVFHNA